MRRRTFLSSSAAAGLSLATRGFAGAQDGAVSVGWLGGAPPALASGVSWGVPWPRGTIRKEQAFTLSAADGQPLPLQTWPLAYWPDGSLKWSGFATVAPANATGTFHLSPGSAPAAAGPAAVTVKESGSVIDIDTGALQCRIPRQGSFLFESMTIDGRVVARQGRLAATVADRPELDGEGAVRVEGFSSQIQKVTAEQTGPVRAVVKIEGVHKSEKGSREWLPFSRAAVFLWRPGGGAAGSLDCFRWRRAEGFHPRAGPGFRRADARAGPQPPRAVFGRGRRACGPSRSSRPPGRRFLGLPGRGNLYADQLAGKRIPNKEEFDQPGQTLLNDWAVWDSFKLFQATADGFTIQKRTNPQSCWLEAGCRPARLGAGVRRRRHGRPGGRRSRISGNRFRPRWRCATPPARRPNCACGCGRRTPRPWTCATTTPGPTGWLRVTRTCSRASARPNGVARTSELMLYPSAGVPAKAGDRQAGAESASQPPLLVCTPQYLHSVRAFGIWSLPDRSTPVKRAVEEQLDSALAFYEKEVEQRHWYGFWNYGDIMHAYDTQRHVWRYDIGGYAWDNTELGQRHVAVVQLPAHRAGGHLPHGRGDDAATPAKWTCTTRGRFAGLGSRHNVRHWGCGAKEVRISQAASRRFHYYLTTDERTGDMMREVVDADYKIMEIDPMRLAAPRTGPIPYPGRIRGGPDWLACVGNWMTEWERTGNTSYRDKILAGMDSISKMPYGFMSGPSNLFGYDPKTGMLYTLADDPFGTYNLQIIQGGAEVVFELNDLIDHPGWQKAWLQYCRLTEARKEVVAKDMTTGEEGADGSYAGRGRPAAYAYMQTKNPAFLGRAREVLGGGRLPGVSMRRVEGPEVLNPIDESPGAGTNGAAQTSLTIISVLEMCKDRIE